MWLFKPPKEETLNSINQLLFFQMDILGYLIISLWFTAINRWKMQGTAKHSRHPPCSRFQNL